MSAPTNNTSHVALGSLEWRLSTEYLAKFRELLNPELALAIAKVTIDFLSKEKG